MTEKRGWHELKTAIYTNSRFNMFFTINEWKSRAYFVHLHLTFPSRGIRIDSVWCTLPQCGSYPGGIAFHDNRRLKSRGMRFAPIGGVCIEIAGHCPVCCLA